METNTRGPMTAAKFFALGLAGATMTAAAQETKLAYSTVFHAKRGGSTTPQTAKMLEAWSRAVPSAMKAGAWIDAAMVLGLAAEVEVQPTKPAPVRRVRKVTATREKPGPARTGARAPARSKADGRG